MNVLGGVEGSGCKVVGVLQSCENIHIFEKKNRWEIHPKGNYYCMKVLGSGLGILVRCRVVDF